MKYRLDYIIKKQFHVKFVQWYYLPAVKFLVLRKYIFHKLFNLFKIIYTTDHNNELNEIKAKSKN